MKQRIVYNLVLILMVLSVSLAAQDKDISWIILGGGIFPAGPFSEKIGDDPRITRRFGFDYGEEAGLAGSGLGLGIEFNQKVFMDNLHWVISTKFLLNTVDNKEIESFFQEELTDSVDIAFENGIWMNLPIFTGFSYFLKLSEGIRVYGTLQCGLNISQQPYRKAIVDGEVAEETTFRITPDFGFETGLGFEFNKKYHIGVRYLNLSAPRYEGTRKLDESFFTSIPKREMNVDGDERPVSMILVYLGYTL